MNTTVPKNLSGEKVGLAEQDTPEAQPKTTLGTIPMEATTSETKEDKTPDETEVEGVLKQIDLVKIKSLSGAQRRKVLKEQKLKEGKEWLPKNKWREKTGLGPKISKKQAEPKEGGEQTPSTSSGNKRGREDKTLDTPSTEGKPSPKRPRQEIGTTKQTYSTVASVFRMAVIQQGYPLVNLTQQQAEQIQMALFEEIKEDASRSPKFKRVYLDKGALIFVCDGQDTTTWLRETVPGISPWEDAQLQVKTAAELFKTAKISLWVPKLLKDIPPATLFNKIRAQNQKIVTECWRVINRKVEANGQTIVVEVDEKSLKTMRELDLKIYLGFSQVHVRVIKDIKQDGGNVEPESAAD